VQTEHGGPIQIELAVGDIGERVTQPPSRSAASTSGTTPRDRTLARCSERERRWIAELAQERGAPSLPTRGTPGKVSGSMAVSSGSSDSMTE
jgi:hypothetical protein